MISRTKTGVLDEPDICHFGETLAEGQTSVSFSLLEDGAITADMAGSISASYAGTDPKGKNWGEKLGSE